MSNYFQDYSEQFHKPGYVYAIESVGFGGLVPGLWEKRIKIGISNNPERRVHELAGTQPPCNFKIIHQVYVHDMASVEDSLHQAFEHKHVELDRSTEWFSLYPWELKYLIWLMDRYAANRRGISYKHAAIALAVVFGLGVVATFPTVNFIQGLATEVVENEKR